MVSDRLWPAMAPVLRSITTRMRAVRQSQIDVLPRVPDRVVFLGDSITRGGMWSEWFPELPTLNRGIDGDTIGGVAARLESALVEPRAVSLLIGTNDLSGLGRSRDVDEIASQMKDLVRRIGKLAPSASLFVNSVTPRSAYFAPRIEALNDRYRRIANDAGANFIDLWPALAGPDRVLLPELTSDGLHLRGAGYQRWAEVLRPHLAPFGSA
jgi:lysophospholipase L1-like esterase